MTPHRLRRAALHLPLRRSERGLLYFHHGLLESEANFRDIGYNYDMARGWESKSVEQQMENAHTNSNSSPGFDSAPEEIELRKRREGLLLQRSRVRQEIEASHNPRYRELLKEMLRHLEDRLSSLHKK
jgi:hypothetical protein